jgi:hypothetical protein
MRLRSPAENALRARLVHPESPTLEQLKEECFELGLDYISDAYVQGLKAKLKPPAQFYPFDRNHSASRFFLLHEGLNSWFSSTPEMEGARELLELPRAREFVDTMLITYAPHAAIAAYVTRAGHMSCTVGVIEKYAYYFWNMSLLDSTQLRLLLQMRVKWAAERKEFDGTASLLKSTYYKDPRRIAAELPHSALSALAAQIKMGHSPNKLELTRLLEETRDMAILNANTAVKMDGPGDNEKFVNYVNGARACTEMIEMVVKPTEHLQKELQTIALRTDATPIKSIHELSGGHHTVDVLPQRDPTHDGDSVLEPVGSGHAGNRRAED